MSDVVLDVVSEVVPDVVLDAVSDVVPDEMSDVDKGQLRDPGLQVIALAQTTVAVAINLALKQRH